MAFAVRTFDLNNRDRLELTNLIMQLPLISSFRLEILNKNGDISIQNREQITQEIQKLATIQGYPEVIVGCWSDDEGNIIIKIDKEIAKQAKIKEEPICIESCAFVGSSLSKLQNLLFNGQPFSALQYDCSKYQVIDQNWINFMEKMKNLSSTSIIFEDYNANRKEVIELLLKNPSLREVDIYCDLGFTIPSFKAISYSGFMKLKIYTRKFNYDQIQELLRINGEPNKALCLELHLNQHFLVHRVFDLLLDSYLFKNQETKSVEIYDQSKIKVLGI